MAHLRYFTSYTVVLLSLLILCAHSLEEDQSSTSPISEIQFEGEWQLEKNQSNLTNIPALSNKRGLSILKIKGREINQRIFLQLLDGFDYENSVLEIEFANPKFKEVGNKEYSINYDQPIILEYKTFYSIPWSQGIIHDDLEVELSFVISLVDESPEKVDIKLQFRPVDSENQEPTRITTSLKESEMGVQTLLPYCILFNVVMVIKVLLTWKLVDYSNILHNRRKFSFYTMFAILMWDQLIFKGYIIPIHTTLPMVIRVTLSTGFFVALFFETILFCMIAMSTALQQNRPGEAPTFSFSIWTLFLKVSFMAICFLFLDIHSLWSCTFLSFFLLPQIYKNYNDGIVFEKIVTFIGYNSPLLLFAYFIGYPNSIGHVSKSYNFAFYFLAIVVAQGVALHLQSLYDPSLFSRRRNIRENEYYRFEDDIEQGTPKDEVCSICLQKLSTIPMVEGWLKNKINVLLNKYNSEDKHIMRTVCGHRYHVACLIGWIENKPECPMCRTKLEYFI